MTPASTPVPPAAGDVAALREALARIFWERREPVMGWPQLAAVAEKFPDLPIAAAARRYRQEASAALAGPLAGPLAEWRATLEARLAAAEEEIAAVDRALEGLAETPRAERVAHWIGVAAVADTRAAEAEAALATETAAREAAEARAQRLLIAFHDATRRPLGVTPDSGLEFYDARLADEAEERRPQHGSPQERAERPEVRRAAAEAEAALMRADALRYRFLRDYRGYAYGQDYVEPSPAECGITWCWQQAKPGETADFDALIDADIARLDEDARAILTGADHAEP